MTNRPICPKGQRKIGSPCIFCQDGSYCAHQYYCPETRRYENTGWRECRRLKPADVREDAPGHVDTPCVDGRPQAASTEAPISGDVQQETKKEVTKVGAKKTNRRKPRKG